MTKANASEFFDAWSIYDQVLDHNYMFHDEMFHDVQRLLAGHYGNRPFTVLDLGCGSARHLGRALQGRSVDRYVGYDLSDVALAHATPNLSGLNCPIELHQGDLLDGLKASDGRFDLIFSSFALHHLVSADKAVFFQLAYQKLNENGLLVLIDVLREEDEDLRIYLEHYCDWVQSEWKTLSPEACDLLCDHIRNNDFAETASQFHAMATNAGFRERREINRFRWHHTCCFEKSPSVVGRG
jgi:SAM-dependent methyltransferase